MGIIAALAVPAIGFGAGLFYIDDSGNMGLGNITPQHRLDVSGAMYSRLVTVTDAASTTVDWNQGNVQSITLTTGDTHLTFANAQAGGEYKLIINQDSTGGRTITWPSSVTWAGGIAPALTADANGTDVVSFIYQGTKYLGSAKLNFGTGASVSVLAVGGGGGGSGGGGGGGGVVTATTPVEIGTYSIVVGAGGLNGQHQGEVSTAFSLIAVGGGYGSDYNGTGGSGGSGGGGAASGGDGGPHTTGQGFDGGIGAGSGGTRGGGGGGGAGGKGDDASANTGGNGGAGYTSGISGSSVCYAGGGGGSGSLNPGTATCGGGSSTTGSGNDATANTGGGGGGSYNGPVAGKGGSGIVIISYPTGSITASGGTVTTSGGNTIHTFTSSGTFTVTAIN